MAEKKDFAGISRKHGRFAVLWGIVAAITVPVTAIMLLRDGFSIKSIKYIVMAALAVFAAVRYCTVWKQGKRLSDMLSCKMTPEEIESIWKEEDDEKLFFRIGEYLCDEKCSKYNSSYKLILNEPEQVIYVLFNLDCTVRDEGFQCFFDEYSDYFNDALADSARKVGCNDVAAICETALQIHSGSLPEEETAGQLGTKCDRPYLDLKNSSKNIATYCAAYARNHKEYYFL